MSTKEESPLEILSRVAEVSCKEHTNDEQPVELMMSSENGGDDSPRSKSPTSPQTSSTTSSSSPPDQPLDFSMKTTQPRPSVIRTTTLTNPPIKKRFKPEPTANQEARFKPEPTVTKPPEDDSFIDEHFKRSLGLERYSNIFNTPETNARLKAVPSSLECKSGDKDKEEVGLSVDDHFAKALGKRTWDEISSGGGVGGTVEGKK